MKKKREENRTETSIERTDLLFNVTACPVHRMAVHFLNFTDVLSCDNNSKNVCALKVMTWRRTRLFIQHWTWLFNQDGSLFIQLCWGTREMNKEKFWLLAVCYFMFLEHRLDCKWRALNEWKWQDIIFRLGPF